MVTALSWVAVVLVLAAYASGNHRLFDWANLTLCVPVGLPAILTHAYSSAAISIAFGVIGGVGIVRRRREV